MMAEAVTLNWTVGHQSGLDADRNYGILTSKRFQHCYGTGHSMNISSIILDKWEQIHEHSRTNWIYRGQQSAKWELSTSLERCCQRKGIAGRKRYDLESELVREFKRAYHHYSQHVPQNDAHLEWISLMQHHGAPTRLLDCTYSIYVAVYFAVEAADSDCAVWAINTDWALEKSISILRSVRKSAKVARTLRKPTTEEHELASKELLFKQPFSKVAVPLSPFRLNERLRTQRSTFLIPGDITVGFMNNLASLVGYDQPTNVIRIVLSQSFRRFALRQLYDMNISRRSLFPGLDGYAQSLGIYHPAEEDFYLGWPQVQLPRTALKKRSS